MRFPEVSSLHGILPRGAEGGKEFARVVDLLLFRESRRRGETFLSFNDSAGDYYGLDSLAKTSTSPSIVVGFQYKFYPSPLSKEHRKQIREALAQANLHRARTGITKWVLVTPDNLTQSSSRADGGDVEWFSSLQATLGVDFEIEHWGHRQLVELFVQTQHICLYYYPDLVPGLSTGRRHLKEVKSQYLRNLAALHGKIQFVGMSVYRQEAANGVPIEQIYIPLKIVKLGENGRRDRTRRDPLLLLTPGAKSVVLGDPGSGKSTLLSCLALVGTHSELQTRLGAQDDDRLPIHVSLRRYSNELTRDEHIPLLDFIVRQAKADLSLPDADETFFRAYLEAGKGVVLFDGLDELPDQASKQSVRDRISSFSQSFPGVTIVVTSRIVGYDSIRFDDKDFSHFQVGSLELPDIERFIREWYALRLENQVQRSERADQLIALIRSPRYAAIRELSENPLLLTILALVHRLDTTLPDERVFLYDKCTETLLTTWHSRKYGAQTSGIQQKKADRLNRSRMEAIGFWMQKNSRSRQDRTIVSYSDLRAFLASHIAQKECPKPDEGDPQDIASDFLEFVKERTGLLLELGTGKFCFIHLTFQEFLAARYLASESEAVGVSALWSSISQYCSDPKWHEVLRLLAAYYRDHAQRLLVAHLLDHCRAEPSIEPLRLLAGCLLDGVKATEERIDDAFQTIIARALEVDADEYAWAIQVLQEVVHKGPSHSSVLKDCLQETAQNCPSSRMNLRLLSISLGWSVTDTEEMFGPESDPIQTQWLDVLFGENRTLPKDRVDELGNLSAIRNGLLTRPGTQTTLACALTLVLANLIPKKAAHYCLSGSLAALAASTAKDWHKAAFLLTGGKYRIDLPVDYLQGETDYSVLEPLAYWAASVEPLRVNNVHNLWRWLHDSLEGVGGQVEIDPASAGNAWRAFSAESKLSSILSYLICDAVGLAPRIAWASAIRRRYLAKLDGKYEGLNAKAVPGLIQRWASNSVARDDEYLTGWFLILDAWLASIDPRLCEFRSAVLYDLSRKGDGPTLRAINRVLSPEGNGLTGTGTDERNDEEETEDDDMEFVLGDEEYYTLFFDGCKFNDSTLIELMKLPAGVGRRRLGDGSANEQL